MLDSQSEGSGGSGMKIDRRHALLMLGLAAALPTRHALSAPDAAIELATAQDPTGAQPNIILIVTDDLNSQTLAQMPHIDALLREQGTSFSEFFVTDPSCGPSRATILRGQYVHNHGMLSNGGELGGFRRFHELDREASTIATWLQDAGYRTGLVGKYLNGYPKGVDPSYVPPGWDAWFGLISTQYYAFKYNDNGDVDRTKPAPKQYQTDVLSQQAQAFVEQAVADAEPFFLYLATKAPHDPAIPAARHEAAFPSDTPLRTPAFNEADVSDKPAYIRAHPELNAEQIEAIDENYRAQLRTMLAVDEMVGDLVATLDEAGVLDNTYIFFTSDNGFFSGEHRMAYGKGLPYDPSLQVPLLVRGPGVPQGQTESRLTNTSDLAPTIADLAGAAVPDFVDGRSLVPLLRGEDTESWRHVTLVEDIAQLVAGDTGALATPAGALATPEAGADDEDGEDSRGVRGAIPAYRALRAVDQLYVDYASGERELYDLKADPFQLQNLASTADPALLASLDERLTALAECAGETCRAAEDNPLPPLA